MADQKLSQRGNLVNSNDDAIIHVVEGGTSYQQSKANFLKEVLLVFADLASLIAAQGTQRISSLYEVTDASGFSTIGSGRAWVRYKGTSVGDETDYIIVSKEEGAVAAGVSSVVAGTNVTVDNTDPANPIISSTGGGVTTEGFSSTGTGATLIARVGDANDLFNGTKIIVDDSNETVTIGGSNNTETTITGQTSLSNSKIINLADGVNSTDAVNKSQLDSGVTQVNASILGAVNLDWILYTVFNFTINNGAVTFSDVNLPALNRNKVITIYFNVGLGTDSVTVPAYWDKDVNSDDFDGSVENRFTVECISGGSGTEIVKYSITNIT